MADPVSPGENPSAPGTPARVFTRPVMFTETAPGTGSERTIFTFGNLSLTTA